MTEFVECPEGHWSYIDFGRPGPYRCATLSCRWVLGRDDERDEEQLPGRGETASPEASAS